MRQIYKCMSAVFLCFINPRGPEHFGCNATQNNIHILLLVCGASVTSPLCIREPIAPGRRLSVTSIISSELNVHSINTRFTAPAILLGVECGDLRGFKGGKGGGLPGKGVVNDAGGGGADFLCPRQACVRPGGGEHACAHAHPAVLSGPLARLFLNSLRFPLNDTEGWLCTSCSRSLLNSCPQSLRIYLSENPIFGGRGVLG